MLFSATAVPLTLINPLQPALASPPLDGTVRSKFSIVTSAPSVALPFEILMICPLAEPAQPLRTILAWPFELVSVNLETFEPETAIKRFPELL